MKINKKILDSEYLQYFKDEYIKCNNKIEITKRELSNNADPDRVVLLNNKIMHLTDRVTSAKAVLDGEYDAYDLIGADLYTMIWGNDINDDEYRKYRYNPESILFKIREDKRIKPVKHLREYCDVELAEYVNNLLKNDYDLSRVVEE